MTTALYVYAILYALFYAWVVIDDIRDGEPLRETLGDFALSSIGFVGMIFYFSGATDEGLKTLWKVVSVALVAGQFVLNFYSRRETLKRGTDIDPEKITQGAILFGDVFTLLLLLPCLAMNFIFAYGPFD